MKKRLMILITGLAVALFATQSLAYEWMGVNIHGFISQGYLDSTENNFTTDTKKGTYEFNELGLNFSKQLTDKLRVGTQFFARDFGNLGNGDVKLDWAYADYRFKDWLGLRFGQMKAPHGLYNEYRDVDALRNSILMPQSVYQEVLRDVTLSIQGAGIYGNIDMNVMGWLSYQALYGTQTIDQNTKMSEALIGLASNTYENDNISVDKKYAISMVWDTPAPGLRLGVSYDNTEMFLAGHWVENNVGRTIGDPVTMTFDKYENWVYSMEYTWRNLTLMGEYIQVTKEYDVPALGMAGEKNEPEGWYAGFTYRFADWFELGGYYSDFDSNYTLPEVLQQLGIEDYYGQLKDICVTTRFDLNEYWTLKLEYHDLTGSYGMSAWDNEANFFGIGQFEEDWSMFAAKLTVAF